MNCKKCNASLDPKFTECPVCGNKITWSERYTEFQARKKRSKGRQRLLVGNDNIAEMHKKEQIKAYFGRGNRDKDARSKDIIPVIIAGVLLIVILFSAGNSGKAEENKNLTSATDAIVVEEDNKTLVTLTDSQEQVAEFDQSEGEKEQNIIASDTNAEKASSQDAIEVVSPEEQKKADLRSAAYIYLVIDNILKNGGQQYIDYLLDNKNKVVIVAESMLEDDPDGAYKCIWDNLGSKEELPQYRDNGAEYFSFFIDDNEVLHICIATSENKAAYELLPEISEEYESDD